MPDEKNEQQDVSRETSSWNNVDMLDVARVAQKVDERDFIGVGSIKLVAPAKVNLFLHVKGRRNDGYHLVDTTMHALMLHDVLRMKLEHAEGSPIHLTTRAFESLPDLDVPPEKNIVYKAIERLAKAVGRPLGEGEAVRVHIEKHIPAQAGLGGGSSDAAAALVGAAKLWGLEKGDPRIEEVAASLGADVPFFLRGGCAEYDGVGERFVRALQPMNSFAVLVKPAGGVSTAESYRLFDENPVAISDQDSETAHNAISAQDVPLRNNMALASEGLLPVIGDVRTYLSSQDGVQAAMMSGSGAAVFALCDSFAAASRIAGEAQAKGWWARTTTFSSIRAALVPNR